jgi:hypothetical protein
MMNQGRLREGMTEDEVQVLLGPPTSRGPGEKKGWTRHTYASGEVIDFYQRRVKYFQATSHAWTATGAPMQGTPPPPAATAAIAPSKSKGGGVVAVLIVAAAIGGAAYFLFGGDEPNRPTIPPPTNGPSGRPKIGR